MPEQLFKRLKKTGVVINVTKIIFGTSEVEYLGHLINQHGIITPIFQVKVIKKYKRRRKEIRFKGSFRTRCTISVGHGPIQGNNRCGIGVKTRRQLFTFLSLGVEHVWLCGPRYICQCLFISAHHRSISWYRPIKSHWFMSFIKNRQGSRHTTL